MALVKGRVCDVCVLEGGSVRVTVSQAWAHSARVFALLFLQPRKLFSSSIGSDLLLTLESIMIKSLLITERDRLMRPNLSLRVASCY